MRILLSSYSASTRSSYGKVTREIWKRVAEARPDLEIVQHGWFHSAILEPVPWDIYPTKTPTLAPGRDGEPPDKADQYGDITLPDVLKKVQPDLVWGVSDPWMGSGVASLKKNHNYKLIYYCPVDSEPMHRRWEERIAASDSLVAFGKYGKGVLENLPSMANRRIDVIPHGVDTNLYQPCSKELRRARRREFLSPDYKDTDFILGWVGKDQFRKQPWVLYQMMWHIETGEWVKCKTCEEIIPKEFDPNAGTVRDYKNNRCLPQGYNYKFCLRCGSKDILEGKPRDDIWLWAHMRTDPITGYDLEHLHHSIYNINHIGYTEGIVDDTGLVETDIAQLYTIFDALVYPTGGEGFGLPMLESMSCGIPVIYSNYSAHTDFVVGLSTQVQLFPEVVSQRYRSICNMGDLLKNVFTLFPAPRQKDHNLLSQLGKKARKVAENYNWDNFTESWLKVIDATMRNKKIISLGDVI